MEDNLDMRALLLLGSSANVKTGSCGGGGGVNKTFCFWGVGDGVGGVMIVTRLVLTLNARALSTLFLSTSSTRPCAPPPPVDHG